MNQPDDNVVALPGYSVPSYEPVPDVIEILQAALDRAKIGKLVGVAIVEVSRDPMAFDIGYHATQNGRHTLAAGVLALGVSVGKTLTEDE